jgi:hypothetical protein
MNVFLWVENNELWIPYIISYIGIPSWAQVPNAFALFFSFDKMVGKCREGEEETFGTPPKHGHQPN